MYNLFLSRHLFSCSLSKFINEYFAEVAFFPKKNEKKLMEFGILNEI